MFSGLYSGKRVLVTGHTGFKGSWLCQWLSQLGAQVAGFSLYLPSEPSNFAVLRLDDRIMDRRGDIRDLAALTAALQSFQPEVVFHLAAQSLVRASYEEPKTTFDTNLGGTVNVLEAIRATPSVQVAVMITSDKCYENVEWDYGYRETDRLGGKDPYSASKACAEIAISAYYRSFLEASAKRMASARAGNVIGGGDWAKDRIVPDCAKAWSSNVAATVRNPGATRPWQHVLEPLSGYLWLGAKLIEGQDGLSGEAFNFGPAGEVNQPVSYLIGEMAKVWGDASWKVNAEAPAGKSEAGLLKLCCDKALQRLGWKATLTLDETIGLTAGWYRDFYAGGANMIDVTDAQIQDYQKLALQRGAPWAR